MPTAYLKIETPTVRDIDQIDRALDTGAVQDMLYDDFKVTIDSIGFVYNIGRLPDPPRIQNRDSLLADLGRLLMQGTDPGTFPPRELHRIPLVNLAVELYDNEGERVARFLGAQVAIHYLVGDIYTDGEADWSDAATVKVAGY